MPHSATNKPVEPDVGELVLPDINPVDIRFSAMNLLARREHTQKELIQKLKRRFPDTVLLEIEIQRLSDENLQSDERFAENYVRYRSELGFGLMRIRQDMRQRGLSDTEISQALEAAAVDWAALSEQVFRKKYGEQASRDIKEKAKRMRFMQYRGFSSDEYQHLL